MCGNLPTDWKEQAASEKADIGAICMNKERKTMDRCVESRTPIDTDNL